MSWSLTLTAQIPCDSEYGEHCPEESGWSVGDCLKNLNEVSSACSDFISMTDICKKDIEEFCSGKEYTGDMLVCLQEWTNPDNLTTECLNALPKKAAQGERVKSEKELKKAMERKRMRNKAAKEARKFNSEL